MAPDLNSVPPSPRNRAPMATTSQTFSPPLSRRTSTMGPPPLPQTSTPSSPRLIPDNTGVGVGPGPLRHPQPMTPAELHLELEKEQEAAVNRLTRELSLLRQQTASVVSNTSSNSVGDSIVPTSARRHRSSSNLSTRSITAVTTGATSVSGVAPARESSIPASSRPSTDLQRPSLSRENSIGASRHSITASPALTSGQSNLGPGYASHRQSMTIQPGLPTDYTQHPRSPSFSSAIAAARYEEAAFHRAELESVKRENEALKQRIRELERNLHQKTEANGAEAHGAL